MKLFAVVSDKDTVMIKNICKAAGVEKLLATYSEDAVSKAINVFMLDSPDVAKFFSKGSHGFNAHRFRSTSLDDASYCLRSIADNVDSINRDESEKFVENLLMKKNIFFLSAVTLGISTLYKKFDKKPDLHIISGLGLLIGSSFMRWHLNVLPKSEAYIPLMFLSLIWMCFLYGHAYVSEENKSSPAEMGIGIGASLFIGLGWGLYCYRPIAVKEMLHICSKTMGRELQRDIDFLLDRAKNQNDQLAFFNKNTQSAEIYKEEITKLLS